MIECLVAVAIVGLGVAVTLPALTKVNSYAAMSRNATGAYAAIQNEVDAFLCNGPFNPQKTNSDGSVQVPPELVLGKHADRQVPIYKESATNIIVMGTLSTTVTDVSQTFYGITMYMYSATVTVSYTYLNRKYSYSMTTVRTSDI